MSRPTVLLPEIIEDILARIGDGLSLREICAEEAMPARSTIYRAVATDPAFRARFELAMAARAEMMADELLEIADDARNDFVARQGNDGEPSLAPDHEHIARSKLRIDSRKWLLSKLLPKKFGDRIAQELSGPDGGPMRIDAEPVSELEVARRIAFLLALGRQKMRDSDVA